MKAEDVARMHSMSELKAGQLSKAVHDPEFAADIFHRMLNEDASVVGSAYRALASANERAEAAAPAPAKKSTKKKSKK